MESGEGEKRENCSTSRGKRLLRALPAPAPVRGTAVRRAMRAAFMAADVAVGGCPVGRSVGEALAARRVLAAPPPMGAPSRAASIYTRGGRCSAGPAPPRRRNVPLPGLASIARPVPFAVARRQARGEASVPPAAPRPGAAPCPLTLVTGQCQRLAAWEPRTPRCPLPARGSPSRRRGRWGAAKLGGLPSVPCLCPAWMRSLGLKTGLVTSSSCTANSEARWC